ncbi:hypothetical protein [Pontibacter fetidus]|uniref:Uncharacterized protein n=1 Tax=Pontibacter fetidus TaxID=2700082 RepID=A0A6B2H018_9BACT|nr:hypothetical protein [Pontibacter fetidus]NDK55468.1 hypothetical protein [Pontibacter fetidus]
MQRSDRYQARYNAWLKQGAHGELVTNFYKACHYKKAGIACSYRVQLIEERNRQGVILFYAPTIDATEFSYFFDFLKDQVLQQGYQLHSTDKRKLKHERYTQDTETYLLTPLPANLPGTAICNQLYGNILIDFTRVNQHAGYIRFITDTFTDTYFSAPLPFSDLLTNVLQLTEN